MRRSSKRGGEGGGRLQSGLCSDVGSVRNGFALGLTFYAQTSLPEVLGKSSKGRACSAAGEADRVPHGTRRTFGALRPLYGIGYTQGRLMHMA